MIEAGRQLVDDQGRRLSFDAPVTAIIWSHSHACFALGDGRLCREHFASTVSEQTSHSGPILCAALHPDGQSIVTGGDDGKLVCTAPDQSQLELANFGSKWVEHVIANAASGVIVAGVAKQAIVWTNSGDIESHRFTFPSTVAGLALDEKGVRLAAAHYGGVTLHAVAEPASKSKLNAWVGSHLSCTLSANGRFLVSALQETGLHGWIVASGTNMAMSGYGAKTKSFSWNSANRWLASSGSYDAVLWPFDGKKGPMGKYPLMLGIGQAVVTRVAFHPAEDILLIGHADGAVILCRVNDNACFPVQEAANAAVTAMAWNATGSAFAWGLEDGRAGIIDFVSGR